MSNQYGPVGDKFVNARRTRLQRAVVAGAETPLWETVAYLGDVTPPARSHIEQSVPDRESTTGESISVTGIDDGTLSFSVNWNPSEITHQKLADDFEAVINHQYRIVVPSKPNRAIEFVGRVNSWQESAPVDGNLTAEVGIYIVPGTVSKYELSTQFGE